MTTFIYRISGMDAHLISIIKKRADELEVRIDSTYAAILRIGDTYTKMEMGVGRVKLSALGDGVFTPEIILNDRSVFLYPIRIRMGNVSLACPDEMLAALGAHVFSLKERAQRSEEELKELKNAVYGKAIF